MFRLFAALIGLICLYFASLFTYAHASDPGTYRPGKVYNAIPASSSAICQAQCQGDAQCRSWNFVRPDTTRRSGVCEFLSQSSDPVQSPISISGTNQGQSASSRIIPAGTNTRIIGNPRQIQTPIPNPQTPNGNRRIIREAPPNFIKPDAASYPRNDRRLATPQIIRGAQYQQTQQPRLGSPSALPSSPLPSRIGFRHNLDNHNQRPIPQSHPSHPPQFQQGRNGSQPISTQTRPNLQHRLGDTPQRIIHPQTATPQRTIIPQSVHPSLNRPTPAQAAQTRQTNTHIVPPNRDGAQINVNGVRANELAQQSAPLRHSVNTPPQTYNGSQRQNPNSLFGSLHDDVKVPSALTLADTVNPDAPIPTVQSVPVQAVETSSLAGGPN